MSGAKAARPGHSAATMMLENKLDLRERIEQALFGTRATIVEARGGLDGVNGTPANADGDNDTVAPGHVRRRAAIFAHWLRPGPKRRGRTAGRAGPSCLAGRHRHAVVKERTSMTTSTASQPQRRAPVAPLEAHLGRALAQLTTDELSTLATVPPLMLIAGRSPQSRSFSPKSTGPARRKSVGWPALRSV